jgi:hypothetical protein
MAYDEDVVELDRENARLRARVAKLEDLLGRVVNHGDASADQDLIADIKRATPEAGWTD